MTLRHIAAFVLLVAGGQAAMASDAAVWNALRRDGAIALVRHGEAPGIGDPAGWKLDDCTTQRNLDDAGRAQARALGARLKAERIPVGRLLASPWCRTRETASLLGIGPVQDEPTFANAFVQSERQAELAAGARALIGRWRGPGALVVVTHGENIRALTGRAPVTAELVLVSVGADGGVRELGAVLTPRR